MSPMHIKPSVYLRWHYALVHNNNSNNKITMAHSQGATRGNNSGSNNILAVNSAYGWALLAHSCSYSQKICLRRCQVTFLCSDVCVCVCVSVRIYAFKCHES